MNSRTLGFALVILAALGVLNLFQAVNSRIAPRLFAGDSDHVHESRDVRSERYVVEGKNDVMIDRTFDVSDGDALDVFVQHSDVTVETHSGDQARVVVHVSARSAERAREVFDNMNFEVLQDGDRIIVRSDRNARFHWRGRASIDVHVSIPSTFDVAVASTHGDVDMEDIEGDVRVTTTHGDVTCGDIIGRIIDLITTHGDVETGNLVADEVMVTTTHGDIEADRVEGDSFEATTTHSDIVVRRLMSPTRLATTHGDVELNVGGDMPLQVATTHGDVELTVPASINADFSLFGERVSMPSGLAFTGTLMKKSANGSVGSGGHDITVTTSFGEVVVRAN